MSTAEHDSAIHISNVGPIEHLTITVPATGGLKVLRGPNGCGKSHALRAVQALTAGEGKLPLRDGADKGSVEFDGVRITLGRSTRRSGTLECITLEGRFDLGELVDPGIADAAKADARRIKALLNISQRGVDPEVIYRTVLPQDELAAVCGGAANIHPGDDPNELANRLRRDLQEAARRVEDETAAARRNEDACLAAIAGLDLDMAEPPSNAVEEATDRLATLREQHRAATKQRERAQAARERLAEATPPGMDLAAAKDRHKTTSAAVQRAAAALSAAEEAHNAACDAFNAANTALRAAEQHAAFVEQCREAMQADLDPLPTEDELAAAQRAIDDAKQALADFAVVRQARVKKGQVETFRAQREAGQQKAERLRKAAANVDVALSELVSRLGGPLFVRDGRLMTDHPRRAAHGPVPFAELSDGERYRIALDVSIAALAEQDGAHRFLILGQQAYEALDPANRRAIAERLDGSGVVVITAEATDGELVAETE